MCWRIEVKKYLSVHLKDKLTFSWYSRYSTARLGKHLSELVPVISGYASETEDDDELREICLQTLESFILRCPIDIAPSIQDIIALSLDFIKHDPNFAEDDEVRIMS